MKLLSKILMTLSGLVLLVSGAGLARAATIESVQISPLTYKLEVAAGVSRDATITVKNTTMVAMDYAMEVENFNNVTDDGAPVSFEKSETSGQTLANWISFPAATGTMAAGQKTTLKFSIKVPAGAQAGGYYAAVFVRTTPVDNSDAQLGVIGRVGTLVLVTVPGDISKTLTINETSIPGFIFSLRGDKNFSAKITNTGGTYFESQVVAEIQPFLGKKSTLDLGKHLITQNNARTYEAKWGNKYPFGYYKVTLKAIDGDGKSVTSTGSFWALPYEIAVPGLIVLIGLIVTVVVLIRKRQAK